MQDAQPDVAAAARYLDALAYNRVRSGMERIRWICGRLGDPQVGPPTVHLTGTNGKGSTARLTAALLQAAGRRVGLFTSPHLVHITERILIDGVSLPEAEFAAAVTEIRPVLDRVSAEVNFGPSRFEALTALALHQFRAAGVDARVIEVGIGGRLDTTNVVDAEVAVITTVGLDHMEYLGNSRSQIAADKAGIIKPGAVAVAGWMPAELHDIIGRRCTEVDARLWRAGRDFSVHTGDSGLTLRTPGRTYTGIRQPFRGEHQARNAACALVAAEALLGQPLPAGRVQQAWSAVTNPARFEVLAGKPAVVIDVAHNPEGVEALVAELAVEFPGRPITVVAGINPHKDLKAMLELFAPHTSAMIATQAAHAPATPATELATVAEAVGIPRVRAIEDSAAAVDTAIGTAGPDGVVVCTGSHYWIGEIYERLKTRVSATGCPSCPDR